MMMKTAGKILLTYLLLVLLFTGVLVAVFHIPTTAIEGNLRPSVQQIVDGPNFTAPASRVQPWKLGTFSDCLILGIAYCGDSSHPLQSAMSAKFMMLDGSPIKGAQQMLDDPTHAKLQTVVYSRYWHGNQVVVRPLLCIMTTRGIRIFNITLLTLLWLMLLVVMWRKIDHMSALIIMACLAAVMIPSVPLCFNYVPTFYLALASSLLVLCWQQLTARQGNAAVFFFVIGACTTYFDLLTTPMVALMVPLAVYLLYRKPDRPCRVLIMLSLCWLIGYASLWATKWLLAATLMGPEAFHDAMRSVTQRTVGHNEQDYMVWCLKASSVLFLTVALIAAAVTILLGKSRQALQQHSWMLLVALSSFVWTFVLLEHSWHHLHFTWRTFVVLAIGLGLYWRHTLDVKHPLALFKKPNLSSR